MFKTQVIRLMRSMCWQCPLWSVCLKTGNGWLGRIAEFETNPTVVHRHLTSAAGFGEKIVAHYLFRQSRSFSGLEFI